MAKAKRGRKKKGASKRGKRTRHTGGRRKLHGAALKAHEKRMRREEHAAHARRGRGRKKGRKGRAKRGAVTGGALHARVARLESFARNQMSFNVTVAKNMNRIFHAASLPAPYRVTQMRALGSGR